MNFTMTDKLDVYNVFFFPQIGIFEIIYQAFAGLLNVERMYEERYISKPIDYRSQMMSVCWRTIDGRKPENMEKVAACLTKETIFYETMAKLK